MMRILKLFLNRVCLLSGKIWTAQLGRQRGSCPKSAKHCNPTRPWALTLSLWCRNMLTLWGRQRINDGLCPNLNRVQRRRADDILVVLLVTLPSFYLSANDSGTLSIYTLWTTVADYFAQKKFCCSIYHLCTKCIMNYRLISW